MNIQAVRKTRIMPRSETANIKFISIPNITASSIKTRYSASNVDKQFIEELRCIEDAMAAQRYTFRNRTLIVNTLSRADSKNYFS